MGNPNTPRKPITGQVKEMKPMTQEERKEAAARAYMQKKESIATGVLFNMMHNETLLQNFNAEGLVGLAIEIADAMIEKLYFTPAE
jgi:hypothetical protein